MNSAYIKLVSFDAFDTLIHIKQTTRWVQEAIKDIKNLPENFDPLELRRQLLCSNISAITTLKNLDLLSTEQLTTIQQLIEQEKSAIELVPFAGEVLNKAGSKYKTALISNLGQDYGSVALSVLGHCFDHILFSFEVGYVKPQSEIFTQLITDSGLQPHQILHIGNSYENDFLGATNVGMQAIHLDLRNKNKTNYRISSINELMHYW
jgi:putative hydrolase of the HAD superfamily